MRPAEGPPPRTLRPGQQPSAPANDVGFDEISVYATPQMEAKARRQGYSNYAEKVGHLVGPRRLQTLTVEIRMEVRGDLHRWVGSALSTIPTHGGRKEWKFRND